MDWQDSYRASMLTCNIMVSMHSTCLHCCRCHHTQVHYISQIGSIALQHDLSHSASACIVPASGLGSKTWCSINTSCIALCISSFGRQLLFTRGKQCLTLCWVSFESLTTAWPRCQTFEIAICLIDKLRCRYGSRAVELLKRYYQGEMADLGDEGDADANPVDAAAAQQQPGASSSRRSAENGQHTGKSIKDAEPMHCNRGHLLLLHYCY